MKTTTKADNRPSFQFYPDDWLTEPGLRMCSSSARGMWIDMLCFMFSMPFRGELRHADHTPLSQAELSKLLAETAETTQANIKQLKGFGVAETASDGCIYSRRMVREEKQRLSKAEAGRRGGVVPPGQAKRGSSSSSSTVRHKDIVEYLNEKSGKTFRADSRSTVRFITARLKEGFTVEQMKQVIDAKVAQWKNDAKMAKYIRPATLFNAEKFEGYVNELTPKKKTLMPWEAPPKGSYEEK